MDIACTDLMLFSYNFLSLVSVLMLHFISCVTFILCSDFIFIFFPTFHSISFHKYKYLRYINRKFNALLFKNYEDNATYFSEWVLISFYVALVTNSSLPALNFDIGRKEFLNNSILMRIVIQDNVSLQYEMIEK